MTQRAITAESVAMALTALGLNGGGVQHILHRLVPGADAGDRVLGARVYKTLKQLEAQGVAASHEGIWALTMQTQLQMTMQALVMALQQKGDS